MACPLTLALIVVTGKHLNTTTNQRASTKTTQSWERKIYILPPYVLLAHVPYIQKPFTYLSITFKISLQGWTYCPIIYSSNGATVQTKTKGIKIMTSNNFFLSCNGDLVKTSDYSVLREKFAYPSREITKASQVVAALRAGEFTDLGGYRLAFLTEDGAALSFQAVRENLYQVVYDLFNDCSTGWKVCGLMVECEHDDTTPLYCDHSGVVLFNSILD